MKRGNKPVFKHFLGTVSRDTLKTKYKELCKALHPDAGGTHEDFVAMQAEYLYITNEVVSFPIVNKDTSTGTVFGYSYNPNAKYPKTPDEAYQKATNLTPEELNNLKATNFFNELRKEDLTYDILDTILTQASKEKLNKLWVYSQVKKQYGLDINHFKYVVWKSKDTMSTVNTLWKSYYLSVV